MTHSGKNGEHRNTGAETSSKEPMAAEQAGLWWMTGAGLGALGASEGGPAFEAAKREEAEQGLQAEKEEEEKEEVWEGGGIYRQQVMGCPR